MTFDHLMSAVRRAAETNGPGTLSLGEALAAALVLNRPDWLGSLGFTIAQALDRIDSDAADLLPRAEKQWNSEVEDHAQVAAIATRAHKIADLLEVSQKSDSDDPLDLSSELVTYGDAPGYRDVSFVFDVKAIGRGIQQNPHRVSIRIRSQDAEQIVHHLLSVHRFAWSRPNSRPLDAGRDEQRPRWIDLHI